MRQLLDPNKMGTGAGQLFSDLRKSIIGQETAIDEIVSIYETYLAGLSSPGRPIGNLLFLGPTGSGKTRTVEAMAESLVGDLRAVIKINCAEFEHGHEIAKLVGSPPGYLGHRETQPLLSQEALNRYHTENCKLSFVLFDEIEKSSEALHNLLLGILDKASLTLGDNRQVDFSHCIIFMTSNLGALEMENILRPNLGFAAVSALEQLAADQLSGKLSSKLSDAGTNAARRIFRPEFMNRIDKTIVFNSLGPKELGQILSIEIEDVRNRISNAVGAKNFQFTLSSNAREYLLQVGTNATYGARHLKRAIEHELVHRLSKFISTGQLQNGDLVQVDFVPNSPSLTFYKEVGDAAPETPHQATIYSNVGLASTGAAAASAGKSKKGKQGF